MDYQALAQNISKYRKDKNLTQERLAELLGVSSQAVSKWENGQSCPDIAFLPKLAEIFGVSIDDLFSLQSQEVVKLLKEDHKSLEDLILRVRVISSDGDKVSVNLPAPLLSVLKDSNNLNFDMNMGGVNLQDIDFDRLLQLAQKGVVGKLVEVESGDGDIVEVYID